MLNLFKRSPNFKIMLLIMVSLLFANCFSLTIKKNSKKSVERELHPNSFVVGTQQNVDSLYQLLGSEDGVIRLNRITGEKILITWKQLGYPDIGVKGVIINDSENTAIDDYGSIIYFDGEKWILENKKIFPNRNEFYGDSLMHQRRPIMERGLHPEVGIMREVSPNPSLTEQQGTTATFDGEKWIIYNSNRKMSDEEIILGIILDDLGKKWKIIKK